jgi:integrase
MVEFRVPGVKVYRSGKKRYAYHRKTGKRIRAPFGTSAFVAEVERIERGEKEPRAVPGTLGILIERYRGSPEFAALAPRTQADYQKVFDYLKPLAVDLLDDINAAYVLDVRDAAFVAHKRRFANYVLAVLRLMLKWGAARDLVALNAAAAVPKLRRPRDAPKANRAWTDAECETVLAETQGGVRVIFALGMFAGMREGDAVRAQRSWYDGAWLRWSQGKTGNVVELPADVRLKAILDAAIAARGGTVTPIYLAVGRRGQPYTENGFRTMFFRLVRRLEKEGRVGPDLTFHGLRHTAGKVLGDLGTDLRTIAALLGHKTEAMAAHYSQEADRRRRAAAAVSRLSRRRSAPKNV